MKVIMDFETRCFFQPKAVGLQQYAKECEVLCLSYKIDDHPVTTFRRGDPAPQDLFDAIANGAECHAHNAAFEMAIWEHHCVAKLGWPAVKPEQWHCTAAKAAAAGLPRSLDNAGKALSLKVSKSKEGHFVMKKMAAPRARGSKDNADIWWDNDELYEQLVAYCEQDVLAEKAIDDATPKLLESEQKLWLLDQKINDRGIKVDMEMAEATVQLWTRYCHKLNTELKEITNGRIRTSNQQQKIIALLREQGVVYQGEPISTLKKEVLVELMSRPEAPLTPLAQRVLEIRQELAKTSIGKFKKMLKMADPVDHRLRGHALYYGAHTGRWTAKHVQTHNLPRGILKPHEIEDLVDAVKEGDLDRVLERGPLGNTLSSLIRPTFIAEEGHRFIACDYASVEARGIAWLAGQDDLVDMFHRGEPIYEHMAADIFGVSVDEVTPEQRQVGKQAVLGCFAADTQVITNNGVKPIVEVDSNDLLWDGVEWVSHEGVVYQGQQQTINVSGIDVTPDHEFLTKKGWVNAWLLNANTAYLTSASELAASLSPDMSGEFEEAWLSTKLCVLAAKRQLTTLTTYITVRPHGAILVGGGQAYRQERSIPPTEESCLRLTANGGSAGIQQCALVARTPQMRRSSFMGRETWLSTSHGSSPPQSFWPISAQSRDGMSHISLWTELTPTAVTSRETSGLSPFKNSNTTSEQRDGWSMQGAACLQPNFGDGTVLGSKIRAVSFGDLMRGKHPTRLSQLQKVTPVYDVKNAGPRHRFTIVAPSGEKFIVHNCGYGMGSAKFQATCHKYGIIIDEELAKLAVDTYRTKYSKIKQFWYDLENAAKWALQHRRKIAAAGKDGRIQFCYSHKWLWMRLPSGRRIAYRDPVIREKLMKPPFPPNTRRPTIFYKGHEKGMIVTKNIYSGLISENATQGMCRDFVADALPRLEAANYPPVLHVHDEIVSEVRNGFGSPEEMQEIMFQRPTWAPDFPLAGEAFESFRYRK